MARVGGGEEVAAAAAAEPVPLTKTLLGQVFASWSHLATAVLVFAIAYGVFQLGIWPSVPRPVVPKATADSGKTMTPGGVVLETVPGITISNSDASTAMALGRGRALNVSYAFCDRLPEQGTRTWLRAQRKINREADQFSTPALYKGYHLRTCVPSPRLPFNRLYPPGHIANYSTLKTLNPRVEHVFMDPHGRASVRVVALDYETGQWVPQLMLLDTILHTLDVFSLKLTDVFGSLRLREVPCVCPQYLGIYGSTLAFVPSYDVASHRTQWRVFIQPTFQSSGETGECNYTYAKDLVPFVGPLHARMRSGPFPCPAPTSNARIYVSYHDPMPLTTLSTARRHHDLLEYFVGKRRMERAIREAAPAPLLAASPPPPPPREGTEEDDDTDEAYVDSAPAATAMPLAVPSKTGTADEEAEDDDTDADFYYDPDQRDYDAYGQATDVVTRFTFFDVTTPPKKDAPHVPYVSKVETTHAVARCHAMCDWYDTLVARGESPFA